MQIKGETKKRIVILRESEGKERVVSAKKSDTDSISLDFGLDIPHGHCCVRLCVVCQVRTEFAICVCEVNNIDNVVSDSNIIN